MTETATKTETPATEAKPAPAPRVKLTLRHGDKEFNLLKYPFPVKAAKFPVKVNGAVVDASCTAGKGKAYTYLLINNTSFYIPGTLPVDAELTVNFPEGYKFDEVQAPRVSTYKPKKPKKEGEAPAPVTEGQPAPAAAAPAEQKPAGEAVARRKGK